MLNIGMTELFIFGIIALLVLGPDKLPEAVRFVGKWYGKVKRTVSNIQNDLDRELRLSELREQMQAEMKRIQELEAKMQAQMQNLQKPLETDQVQHSMTQDQSTLSYKSLSYEPLKTTIPAVYLPSRSQPKTTVDHPQQYLDMKVAV
ncbi:MAG TPA: Sec-independent protein translocase protein TatB [Acinetobacter lwoffii]|uniref:Sec-independent protein translocase protein TatB n=1 Tax=Acinetobacter lwoffii TaxID=28090 RepID=A0A9D2USP9_ACILW|nr:Sec-independent protein translocase protein TatB [Acinetobacter lwoffii]